MNPQAILFLTLIGQASAAAVVRREQREATSGEPDGALEQGDETNAMIAKLTHRARQHFPHAEKALRQLSEMYNHDALDTGALTLSSQETAKFGAKPDWAVYGELLPTSLIDVLAQVGARPGMKYYDLGSGTGKTVALAYLLGLHATGVERVEARHQAACEHLQKMPADAKHASDGGRSAKLVHGSFLDYDFSDAHIVFTDSVLFSDDMMHGLARTARRMKPNSTIITFKEFPGDEFETIQQVPEPTSWDPQGTDWTRQRVLQNSFNQHAAATKPNVLLQQDICQI